jgi:phosphoesterase RecJ-like protein
MEARQLTIPALASTLMEHSSFVLTSHVNPDGDALGSELALCYLLRDLGKTVAVINHSPTPDNLRWLDDGNDIEIFDPAKHDPLIKTAGCIAILDTNQPDRLRSMEPAVLASPARKIIVDHHLDPHPFANEYLTDTEATSTGEILYRLVTHMRRDSIPRNIARALYTAIMTDTGSFRFPRTVAETHRIAAHLLDSGADPTEIYANIYETWSPGRLRLLGEVLDSMRTDFDGKLAYVVCTRESFRATGTSEVDTDNFTVYPMGVLGVVVGILFCEQADGVKVSFRSKGTIPINELAKEFGGNGHLNAAGARLHETSLADAITTVVASVKKYL